MYYHPLSSLSLVVVALVTLLLTNAITTARGVVTTTTTMLLTLSVGGSYSDGLWVRSSMARVTVQHYIF